MNKYIFEIEKQASIKEKAINFAMKNKKKIGAGALGAGALGTGYLIANDDQKKKIKDGVRFAKNSVLAGGINGYLQDGAKYTGAALGTMLGMKRGGKSFKKALATNGLAGLALADIAGAATIPTAQLYRKHKKEFGTAPDAKSLGTVLAANVGPTAAIWGGLYGAKKGIAKRKNIAKNFANGLNDSAEGVREFKNLINKSNGFSGPAGTFTKKDLKNATGSKKKIFEKMKKLNQIDFNNTYETEKDVLNAVKGSNKKIFGGIGKAGKAFAPIAIADQLAGIPAGLAAPQNVIDAKKKILAKKKTEENI